VTRICPQWRTNGKSAKKRAALAARLSQPASRSPPLAARLSQPASRNPLTQPAPRSALTRRARYLMPHKPPFLLPQELEQFANLGKRLRLARRRRGISSAEMARHAFVSRSTVYKV